MNIICLLPCVCPFNSNGVSSLFRIYKALLKAAPSSTYFVSKPLHAQAAQGLKDIFGGTLRTYSQENEDDLLDSLLKEPFVLVRPDDIEGIQNPIQFKLIKSDNCKSIVNILLAPPFVFASKVPITKYYQSKDLFLLGNQVIFPSFAGLKDHDVFLESELDPLLLEPDSHRLLGDRNRPLISVYVGKGVIRPLSKPLSNMLGITSELLHNNKFAFITRSWPKSKRNLYSLLASSKLLISFDPFSHIERVSTVLGTPVLKLCSYNLEELPGVTVCSPSAVTNLPSFQTPPEVLSSSLTHYKSTMESNHDNLHSITSAILNISGNSFDKQVKLHKKLIPFSKSVLVAFSSQLRAVSPLMGSILLGDLNEHLDAREVFDLLTSTNPSNLSSRCLSYISRRQNIRYSFPYQDQFSSLESCYQYTLPRSF